MPFHKNLIFMFTISFGVVVGASLFAGLAAILCNRPPFKTMIEIAISIKIWAVAIAIGGTFYSFEVIEKGLIKLEYRSVIKQVIYIAVALIGANSGYSFIKMLKKCGDIWVRR